MGSVIALTPQTMIADLDSALSRNGEPVKLRRKADATASVLVLTTEAAKNDDASTRVRLLIDCRVAFRDHDDSVRAATALDSLREHSTPYHLAHGLLDQAQHLSRTGDAEGAAAAIDEARGIARQLGCQPLLDRADAMEPAETRARA